MLIKLLKYVGIVLYDTSHSTPHAMYCTHARFDFRFFGLCLMGGRRTLMTTGRVLLVALLLRLNALALTLEGTVVLVVDVARVWLCLGTPTNVSAPL